MNRRSFLSRCLAGAVASCARWMPLPPLPEAPVFEEVPPIEVPGCDECGAPGELSEMRFISFMLDYYPTMNLCTGCMVRVMEEASRRGHRGLLLDKFLPNAFQKVNDHAEQLRRAGKLGTANSVSVSNLRVEVDVV